VKLRDIRFHDAVNVDSKMLEKADEGTACAFGVVVGADSTLVPWTNVRWAKAVEDPLGSYAAAEAVRRQALADAVVDDAVTVLTADATAALTEQQMRDAVKANEGLRWTIEQPPKKRRKREGES
jgi:hypothetical protein